jgi:hypothetical protein
MTGVIGGHLGPDGKSCNDDHSFEPRYDYETHGGQHVDEAVIEKLWDIYDGEGVLEAIRVLRGFKRTYVMDVCMTCGCTLRREP